MKELTAIEMDDISGAGIRQILDGTQDLLSGLVDATVGATIGLIGYASGGGLQGGLTGNGAGGGALGFGTIAMGIGALWGAIQGVFLVLSWVHIMVLIMLMARLRGLLTESWMVLQAALKLTVALVLAFNFYISTIQ